MNRTLIITLAATLLAATPCAAQDDLQRILESVERNNLTLKAEAHTTAGRTLEARTGNSLDPLSVSYSSAGDRPDALGKKGELEVSQSFDLPMLYATRSRIARTLAQQYEAEYLALRQQVLLEAKEVYLELCALQGIVELNRPRLTAAEHMATLFAARFETGDATSIDKHRTEFEYLLLKEELSAIDMRMIELSQRLAVLNGGELPESGYAMPSPEARMPLELLLADWEEYAPDLTALRLQEESARYDVRLSRQQALPKVELGYKYEYGPAECFNGFKAGLSIPILSNRHNVKRARALEEAAKANTESALAQKRGAGRELYLKTEYTGKLLESFGGMPDAPAYTDLLGRMLEAGQINIVDYYSELATFYSALETRIRTDLEYRLGLARLHVIYL